jgi:hypothetical protein
MSVLNKNNATNNQKKRLKKALFLLCYCYGAVEGTCREQSERNSEWLCLHKGTSASHTVWVHTQSVVLKAQSPFK